MIRLDSEKRYTKVGNVIYVDWQRALAEREPVAEENNNGKILEFRRKDDDENKGPPDEEDTEAQIEEADDELKKLTDTFRRFTDKLVVGYESSFAKNFHEQFKEKGFSLSLINLAKCYYRLFDDAETAKEKGYALLDIANIAMATLVEGAVN